MAKTTRHGEGSSSRGRDKTIQNLLDALHALQKEAVIGDTIKSQRQNLEDDRDVPTVDDQLQTTGAESFNKLSRQITDLHRELRYFANALRPLGSSVGILSSSYHLRERLEQVLYLFRENAADIFPRKVVKHPKEMVVVSSPQFKRRTRSGVGSPTRIVDPSILENLNLEQFPLQLNLLAKELMNFLDCLNEFPEFTDEAVNFTIRSLEGDLKYWSSCLRSYEGQFKNAAVQRYVHDLSSELGEYCESLTTAIVMFKEIGVPAIASAQQQVAANMRNMSTLATFFSAVTATTLQFSFNATNSHLANSVNGFWFTSLVFSTGAAVNSLLGMTWKQTIYRSRPRGVPSWVSFWIKQSSLVFIVFSVACFLMGLVLFTYSSNQHIVTSTFTAISTAWCSVGLVAVSIWFAFESYVLKRYEYSDQFWDIIGQSIGQRRLSFAQKADDTLSRINASAMSAAKFTSCCFTSTRNRLSRLFKKADVESDDPPPLFSPTALGSLPFSMSPDVGFDTGLDEKTSQGTTSVARERFRQAVRSVIRWSATSGVAIAVPESLPPPSKKRQRAQATASAEAIEGGGGEKDQKRLMQSRAAMLIPRLRTLEVSQDMAVHTALVKHLQFSPDGKYLASSRTSLIFQVNDGVVDFYRTLAHPQGFVGQVAWRPDGKTLLTKLTRGFKIWTEDGVCRQTIDRKTTIQAVAWQPGGEAFWSVENDSIVSLDMTGHVQEEHRFDRMKLYNITVLPDGKRILLVGTLTASADGSTPYKCRAENQMIAYNITSREIECRIPFFHEIRNVVLARNDPVSLVSYEDGAPPQLWNVRPVKTRTSLSLRHTFLTKLAHEFTGPSYFGGPEDELVLCAGKTGGIFIWDRLSATQLHHISPPTMGGGDLTCLAWNHASNGFMLATGSHDGTVRIWTPSPSSLLDQSWNEKGKMRGTPESLSPAPSSPGVELEEGRTQSDECPPS